MSVLDLPFYVHGVWVVHECLRRLGFVSEDISGVVNRFDDENAKVIVMLETQGKMFVVDIMPVPADEAQKIAGILREGCMAMNDAPQSDLDKVWDKFFAEQPTGWRESLVFAMLAKGFRLPRMADA